jgi:glyoxylase-like metal-dependent hydrolase (beta-lactamase superfamily II)
MKMLHRRQVLASLSAAAVGAVVPTGSILSRSPPASGMASRKSGLKAQPLAEGLMLIQGAGCNVLALRDGDGLVFIDGGLKANGKALLALAHKESGARAVHALVNTHWHPEQTGLNELLGKQGTKIIAHANTRLWLSTTVRYTPDGPPIGPLPASGLPTQTTYTGGEFKAGDETLKYGYLLQAHTDGDLYVKLTKSNVLVTGGVVAGDAWPTADWVTGGWINGTVSGYRALIAQCDDNTRVVTANGARLYSRADLTAEVDILSKVADQLGKMMRAGYGPEDMLAANPAKDYAQKLGDPTQFLTESFKSLWPRLAPDA